MPPATAAPPTETTNIGQIQKTDLGLSDILLDARKKRASDIVYSQQGVIWFRVDGLMQPRYRAPQFLTEFCELHPIKVNLRRPSGSDDFAIEVDNKRYRVNAYKHIGQEEEANIALALRPLPNIAFEPEQIGIERHTIVKRALNTRQGLILVTGPTGSGKSSTITCLIEQMNQNRQLHIISIEDPVEFVYRPNLCCIEQREVGEQASVDTFPNAIRSAMRENPDVIIIGEVRDYITMRTALQAAETGHLVFGTLHTKRAYTTISRLIMMAPPEEKDDIRSVLSNNLQMIICQSLFRKTGGGRIACREIMITCTPIETKIRNRQEKMISDEMNTRREMGMMTWNVCLDDLKQRGHIDDRTFQSERDEI